MITLFTIPKAFRDRAAVHQRNAIASWTRLPGVEVIVCGDDPGAAEAAAEWGARHLPDIERNERGTPYVSSAFRRVAAIARFETLCYANADIVLTRSLLDAVSTLPRRQFLAVSRRINVDLDEPIDFDRADWEAWLARHLEAHGTRGTDAQIDVFVFRRDEALSDMPPFLVGRPVWDNWMIWRARALGMRVVDMTHMTRAIHQNHDYGHIAGGSGTSWEGPEAEENRRIMGAESRKYTLMDATHVATPIGTLPAWEPRRLRVRAAKFALGHPVLSGPTQAIRRALGRA
jgi:hypothetical protein